MKKRILATVIACTMVFAALTGCGSSSGSSGNSNAGANTAGNQKNNAAADSAVTEDGRDANGNIVDRSAFAISLGQQWFTDEDLEIWEHIEEPSSNPDKILIRYANTNRSCDEAASLRGDKRFFIELKKALGDRVEIQLYHNAALGGTADQILGGLKAGSFEVANYNLGAYYEYTKAFTPLDVGFLIPDLEAGIKVCAIGSPAREIMINKCIEDCGIRLLDMGAIGMRHITNDVRPIEKLDDIKGLKIRVQNNNMHMAMFDALGASPTPIAFSELFTALQQHTVDGQENPVTNIFEQNYVEVQRYMTLTNHLYTAGGFACSEEWFQSLPEDVRKIVLDAAAKSQEQSGKDLISCEEAMLDYLGKAGFQISRLPDEDMAKFKESAMSMWDMAGEVMGEDYWNEVRTAIEDVIGD